jgi:ketosteroid isomerase-like protein
MFCSVTPPQAALLSASSPVREFRCIAVLRLLPSFQFLCSTKVNDMKILSAAFLSVMVLAAVLFAQEKSAPSNDEIQIKQLEHAWNEAESRHDVGAVTAIVADTLTYIDFDGSIMNKAEYLHDVTKTAYQADHLYDEGLDVAVYGNAAVVTGIYRETGNTKGKNYVHRVRFTDTWIKRGGVWQCVASQNTLIQGK